MVAIMLLMGPAGLGWAAFEVQFAERGRVIRCFATFFKLGVVRVAACLSPFQGRLDGIHRRHMGHSFAGITFCDLNVVQESFALAFVIRDSRSAELFLAERR